MESADNVARSFKELVLAQLERGADILPDLIAALLILVIGWAIARLARSAVQRLALASNHLLSRVFPRGVLAGTRISSGAASLLGELVFWVVAFITLTVAARVAGITSIVGWLERITAHLPNLFAGAAIIVIGYFLSVYMREQLVPAAVAAGSPTQRLLGRALQGAVIGIALIVGLDQVGVDVAVLVGLAVALAAAIAFGLATAFALGARDHVSNLIGARIARQQLSVGLRVRIADIEGDVLEVTPTHIALDTDSGKALVPARTIDQGVVTVLAPEMHADDDG